MGMSRAPLVPVPPFRDVPSDGLTFQDLKTEDANRPMGAVYKAERDALIWNAIRSYGSGVDLSQPGLIPGAGDFGGGGSSGDFDV